MTTVGQFNSKNPTIKRILKEAAELSNNPSPDYTASPLENNLFEWHFTLRGPPAPSPYAQGIYHGRIVLPSAYPLRPPSFRFLTPSGRFEQNREICLSISGFHEESWQPAWGIRTAIVAIRSFMDSDAKGQVGGINAGREMRESLAKDSIAWRCSGCGGRSNEEIIKEVEELARESDAKSEDKVPEELKLAYRDELEAGKHNETREDTVDKDVATSTAQSQDTSTAQSSSAPTPTPTTSQTISPQAPATSQAAQTRPALQTVQLRRNTSSVPAWIDMAIGGLTAALVVMVLKKILSVY